MLLIIHKINKLTLMAQAMLREHILQGEALATDIAHIGLLLLVRLDVPLHVLGPLESLRAVRTGVRTILFRVDSSMPFQRRFHVEPLRAAAALEESRVLALPLLLHHTLVVGNHRSPGLVQVLCGHVQDQILLAGEGLTAQHALTPLDGRQVLPVLLQHMDPFLRI